MNALMVPHPDSMEVQTGSGGIATTLRAYGKYLRPLGVQFVATEAEADVIAIHAGAYIPKDPRIPVVALNHGLYWTGDFVSDIFEIEMNHAVIEVLRRAQAIVVPSEWVAETIRRDMHVSPYVLGHGVDVTDWEPLPTQPYVLWNKNRPTDVCSPKAVNKLAEAFPRQLFLTTYADPNPTPNVKIVGVQDFSVMRPMVQAAQVYLSTAKETFGIGVLEAMACGVPVLGFAEGGNLTTVLHKVTGYLATPGDYDDLAAGLEYILDNRAALSVKCREFAKTFDWPTVCKKLYDILLSVCVPQKTTVDVIIPCFNYGASLTRAVQSVLKQTYKVNSIFIVDNNSTDDTTKIAKALRAKHKNVFLVTEPRQGVAYARNTGLLHSSADFMCCLDADDMLEPGFIEACMKALLADRTLGLAYTGLRFIKPDGTEGISNWPGAYDYDQMLMGNNCVPTCCVFRREMFERTGGYRQLYAPDGAGAEDAELWLRAGSLGFGGKKATDAPLFVYSMGSGYVSGNPDYQEENWRVNHPWVFDGWHPFASMAKADYASHAVFQRDQPVISVVIPCALKHLQYLWDALDSLEAQTYAKWEAIVVIDGYLPTDPESQLLRKAFPFAKFIETLGGLGAGATRNRGADVARGDYLLFLDADDWLEPEALEKLLQASTSDAIVYSDYYGHALVDVTEAQRLDAVGRLVEYRTKTRMATIKHFSAEFDRALAARQPEMDGTGNFYLWNLITCLFPKAWHKQIGGFDETMPSWEDWDYWLRFARAGATFLHLSQPLVHYRFTTGTRREDGIKQAPELLAYLAEKRKEPVTMCCGQKTIREVYTPPPVEARNLNQGAPLSAVADDYTMVELVDNNKAYHPVVGFITKMNYGDRKHGEQFLMHHKDIEALPHTEGHPRQAIRVMKLVMVNSPDRTLDRTDVSPHNAEVPQDVAPVMLEGVPSIEGVTALTPKMRVTLNTGGSFTVLDLIKLGQSGVIEALGVGPKRAELIVNEAIELESKYGV